MRWEAAHTAAGCAAAACTGGIGRDRRAAYALHLSHGRHCPTLAQGCPHLDVDLGAVESAAALVHHIRPALQRKSDPVTDGSCAVLAAAAVRQAAPGSGQTNDCVAEVFLLLMKMKHAPHCTLASMAALRASSAMCQMSSEPTDFSGRVDRLICHRQHKVCV
jgi:hypothetical protein